MSVRYRRLRVGGLGVAVCWLIATGCTLSNSLFNARDAARRGDALLARGLPDSAGVWFARSAMSAERLANQDTDTPAANPAQLWAAQLLAGRALALAAEVSVESCGRAREYLTQFLTAPTVVPRERWDAELAMAICDVRTARSSRGAARLAVLTATPDSGVPINLWRDVRRWQARALLTSGDVDGADELLRTLDPRDVVDARWDRVDAAWSMRDWPRAESLLVHAASESDLRPTVGPLLFDAWADGERALVVQVVQAYEASRAPRRERARLQLMLGDAARRAGDTARAHAAYDRVLAVYADYASVRGAARVGQLQLALDTLRGAVPGDMARGMRQLLFDASVQARHHPRFHQLASSVALYLTLSTTADPSGGAGYLAGEVARDSLDAPHVAASTWRAVAALSDAPLAARALYAMWLQSAQSSVLRDELLTRFPDTPIADVLRGESVRDMAAHRGHDGLLEGRWLIASRARDDTLRAWRVRGVLADMDSIDALRSDSPSSR